MRVAIKESSMHLFGATVTLLTGHAGIWIENTAAEITPHIFGTLISKFTGSYQNSNFLLKKKLYNKLLIEYIKRK